jgi:hypothetical protein
MYEGTTRSRAEIEYRRSRAAPRVERRPDRIALWAFAMAVIAMVAAAASAHAGSGGTGASGSCSDAQFGHRSLRLGDCGDDVKTLNWVLKADEYGVPLEKDFDNPTDDSVRSFQRRHDLDVDGVVGRSTRRKIVHTMGRSVATWYGPGFFGERTACGVRLHRDTIGVAHRHLACGTKVTLGYHGRYVRARVIDRGPYTNNARWDLTQRTAKRLNLTTTDTIRAAPIK